jgi:DNA-binding response OmpR family regulator
VPQASAAEEPDQAPPAPSEQGAAPSGETILLVEDEPRLAALIASTLAKRGYAVLRASSVGAALEAVERHPSIDLLLTDVVMPEMNGRQLADCVRSMRAGTRVLYMSGYSDDAILRHGVQTATAHFIQKPFSMKALLARIRETLVAAPTG